MLNAFASLKCSKKCEHNVQRPIPVFTLKNPCMNDNDYQQMLASAYKFHHFAIQNVSRRVAIETCVIQTFT